MGFLGIQVCFTGFEAFIVTIQWSLGWYPCKNGIVIKHSGDTFSLHHQGLMWWVFMSVCCTYTQCCQSLVSHLSTEPCPCLI